MQGIKYLGCAALFNQPSQLEPAKYALAIHTSSPDLGLAISNFAGDARSQVWNLGRDLSSHLHIHLMEFLQPQAWADLAFIAVAKGPGGFTGTRIGVVAARTLAQQLEVPLFAISSLAAVAWEVGGEEWEMRREENPPAIAVEMRAQRNEVFGAIYTLTPTGKLAQMQDGDTNLDDDDHAMSAETWQQMLADLENPYQLVQAEGGLGNSTASLLELAYIQWQSGKRPHWSEALPSYGQHPVAK